jgi:hypothetical protein
LVGSLCKIGVPVVAAILWTHGTLRKAVLVIADARMAEDAMIVCPRLVMRNIAPAGPCKLCVVPAQDTRNQIFNITNRSQVDHSSTNLGELQIQLTILANEISRFSATSEVEPCFSA